MTILETLTWVTALGAGLISGVFFAVSTFVMRALARLPPPEGIRAMQAINVPVINPWFLAGFLGTAALSLALAAVSFWTWDEAATPWRLAGSLLYLAGTFLETIGVHLPRNDALAAVDPESPAGADLWTRYLREWTLWNHVRRPRWPTRSGTSNPIPGAGC